MNESGDIVGDAGCGEMFDAVVAWNAGPSTLLSMPGAYLSRAYGINDSDEIVGDMEGDTFGHRAFLHTAGQTINLGTLPEGFWSEAFAINETGIVVGFASVGEVSHAVRWDNGVIVDLNLPVGPDNQAWDINDNQQIVGWMGVYPTGSFFAEAFLWENGATTPLGIPIGGTFSTAQSINNNGVICGFYGYPETNPFHGNFVRRGLLWIDGQMIDLGILAGAIESRAEDINDAGDVVGYCQSNIPPGLLKGFLWRGGIMVALDDLLAQKFSQYQVLYARGINSFGQIAATVKLTGSNSRAALLTPIPPQPGDCTCDWLVNVDDLLAVINAWGPYQSQPFQGSPDSNDDGAVNIDDLLAVINNWAS